MSCFDCNTLAKNFNEIIFPALTILFFIFIAIVFKAVKKIKKQKIKLIDILLFFVIFLGALYLSFQYSPVNWIDTNYYTDKM